MSLDCLPSELYSAILFHIPSAYLQQTVLSLTRALPYSPIPLHHLFHAISIVHPDQAVRLNERIRSGLPKQPDSESSKDDINVSRLVSELSIKTWHVDGDVVVNLIHLLSSLESLALWVGPSGLEPDHLKEMFTKCMPRLKYLSLRFRPYVEQAMYLPFLKAAYFDTMLPALSARPPSFQGLVTLSIVQDPGITQAERLFAQPIIFFQLDLHLSLLIYSQNISASLEFLRIRIPARPIVKPLTTVYPNPDSPATTAERTTSPPIKFLDISTCHVTELDIHTLLSRFKYLEHLILDGCPGLLREGSGQALDWCEALGRKCALSGVNRARQREKELKTWLETRHHSFASGNEPASIAHGPSEPRRPRRGRQGLATSTISLRTAHQPGIASTVPSSTRATGATEQNSIPKIYIIPPLPTLRSISLHLNTKSTTNHMLILAAFERGWNDGIRLIWEKRRRIGTTFFRVPPTGGVKPRFLRFKDSSKSEPGREEPGFEDLDDIKVEDEKIFFRPNTQEGSAGLHEVPILCLSGPNKDLNVHVNGCGHSVAWEIWGLQG